MTAEQVLQGQLQEFLAQQGLASGNITPPEPPKPQPIEIEIGGQKLSFATPGDLQNALNQQLSANAQQIATLENAQAQRNTPAPAADDKEARNIAFYEKFKEDPYEAMNMAMNHNIFQGKVADPGAVLRDAALGSESSRQLIEIARFRDLNQSYNPATDSQSLDRIRQSLNLPITADGLEAAYSMGLNRGIFKIPQQQETHQTALPPSPGRFQAQESDGRQYNSVFDPITEHKLETMPLGTLEEFMKTQGLF